MELVSDIADEQGTPGDSPGGYDWWYFDASDSANRYRLVVIFYRGNPFSRRYRHALEQGGEVTPEDYPAVSISLYDRGSTLFYSFVEYPAREGKFESGGRIRIGGHRLEIEENDSAELCCRLELSEELPSGDALRGELTFEGPSPSPSLFRGDASGETGKKSGKEATHRWNLALPRARAKANLRLETRESPSAEIAWTGTGYHDHNSGVEPLERAFDEWYWGRFHFEAGTLVYFVSKGKRDGEGIRRGWLISPEGERMICRFGDVRLEDRGWSLFGLRTARRIMLRGEKARCTLQQSEVLDSGPFYRRFRSRAFLSLSGEKLPEARDGITEYLRPDRIHYPLFRPLVDMRIRYRAEKPHWVQRSSRLYRWTW